MSIPRIPAHNPREDGSEECDCCGTITQDIWTYSPVAHRNNAKLPDILLCESCNTSFIEDVPHDNWAEGDPTTLGAEEYAELEAWVKANNGETVTYLQDPRGDEYGQFECRAKEDRVSVRHSRDGYTMIMDPMDFAKWCVACAGGKQGERLPTVEEKLLIDIHKWIDAFDTDCEQAQFTPTDQVWDLLDQIRTGIAGVVPCPPDKQSAAESQGGDQ